MSANQAISTTKAGSSAVLWLAATSRLEMGTCDGLGVVNRLEYHLIEMHAFQRYTADTVPNLLKRAALRG